MARIVVVDDEKSIQFLLSELLKRDNHEVQTFSDGADALEVLEHDAFDLVVTDLHMARKTGIDVLRGAKKYDEFIEVLILTGHGTISSAVEAMQLGAFEYLTKPIDLKEFRLKVQKALERRDMRKQIARQQEEIRAHQEMIARDLKLASQVQDSLVPKSLKRDTFEIAVRYSPMIGVGGDFSDLYLNDNREIYLTIVDVTGHGIAAALLVNRICMEIRRLVREELRPASILHQLNDFIVDSFMGTGMFLTMFSSVLDLESGTLRYAGSAHPAALLWRQKTQSFEMLESQNPIIGFEKTSPELFVQNETIMRPGDKITLYTDGIVEIEDRKQRPLGVNGLIELFKPHAAKGTNDIADHIMRGISHYAKAAQRDDVYLICLGLL